MNQNLKFKYLEEEDGYEIIGCAGKPIDLVIDSTYQGKKIISIGKEAFFGCKSIASLTLPNTIKVIKYSAFENCTSLEYVEFLDGLEKIEWRAFYRCSSLSIVEFPDSVKEICESSFGNCTAMTSISIGRNLSYFDIFAFEGCLLLERINVSNNNHNYSSCDGILMNKNGDTIIFCPYGRGGVLYIPEGVKAIDSHAFASCKKIVCLCLPDSLQAINDSAFEGCSGLSEIVIPGELSMTSGSPFDCCANIVEIHFHPNSTTINASSLKSFSRCYSLKRLCIPSKVNRISILGLTQCSSFEEFVVDENNKSFSTIDGILYTKDKTEMVFCPRKKEDKLVIPDGVKTLNPDSIHNCYKIKEVTIPMSVTNIMPGCFSKSKKIQDVIVDGLNNSYCSINGAILTKDKKKIIYWPADSSGKYVEIPKDVEIIGSMAFTDCSNITSITFSSSVKEIEQMAFLSYSKLDTLFFKGTMLEFSKINIHGNWEYESIKKVYCSDGTLPKRTLKKMFLSEIDLSKYCNSEEKKKEYKINIKIRL